MKRDTIHHKVMKTPVRFMVEDDMDYVEAAESTVGKRKFLINRVAEIHKDIHPTSRSTSSRVLNEIIDQMILNQTKYLTVGSI